MLTTIISICFFLSSTIIYLQLGSSQTFPYVVGDKTKSLLVFNLTSTWISICKAVRLGEGACLLLSLIIAQVWIMRLN